MAYSGHELWLHPLSARQSKFSERAPSDRNRDLSRDDKYRQRSKTADQAIADFEASKTLARAREAVELVVAKYNVGQHVLPEIAQDSETTLKAMKEVERSWQRGMDKIAERVALTSPDTGR
jgi:hypothetical protein